MNGIRKEKSRLDWFFYFKRGYQSYLTYLVNLLELAGIAVLDIVFLFHTSTLDAGTIVAAISIPIVWSTYKIGVWDYVKGGKKIEVRLQYANDEVWKGMILSMHSLLQKEGLEKEAKAFRETMIRYGVMSEEE